MYSRSHQVYVGDKIKITFMSIIITWCFGIESWTGSNCLVCRIWFTGRQLMIIDVLYVLCLCPYFSMLLEKYTDSIAHCYLWCSTGCGQSSEEILLYFFKWHDAYYDGPVQLNCSGYLPCDRSFQPNWTRALQNRNKPWPLVPVLFSHFHCWVQNIDERWYNVCAGI